MSASQKGTPNYSMSAAARKRKKFETTLMPETIAKMKRLAAEAGVSVGQLLDRKLSGQ